MEEKQKSKKVEDSNIYIDAIKDVAEGVKIATDIVRQTMGPLGKNICIEMDEFPFSGITNDGASVIEKIDLTHPVQRIGLNAIKEAVLRSNANSGDGSTTTCVLLDAIMQEAIKSGLPSIEIKRELDTLLPEVIKLIDEQKRTITSDEVEAVATIAGESEEIGKLLGEIYKRIGKDGIVHLEGSGTYETHYDFIEGVRFVRTGFLSPYFASEGEKNKAVYEKPLILITKRKIEKESDISKIVQYCIDNKKPLIIFTDDMDSAIASRMVATHRAGVAKICIVKAPVIMKGSVFEDFSKCTGATILEDATGVTFKSLSLQHLGTCDKIIVDKDETVLIGTQDISEHIAELRTQQDDESKMRLSWLTTKTVLLKLGALSETDLYYRMKKVEDAIYSSRLALESGILAGGGLALYNVSKQTDNQILKVALQSPLKQIIINSGKNYEEITKQIDNYGL